LAYVAWNDLALLIHFLIYGLKTNSNP